MPSEVLELSQSLALEDAKKIPTFVYDIFDHLIAKNFDKDSNSSTVRQIDVVSAIGDKHPSIDLDWKWLDIEPKYRSLGWTVKYYNQAYYEEGKSYYVFSI